MNRELHFGYNVLGDGMHPAAWPAIREIAFAPEGDLPGGGIGELTARIGQARESGAAGVLITPRDAVPLARLADVLESHAGQLGLSAGPDGPTLRSLLRLPRRSYLLGEAREAFPAPAS
jgi:hypothetical protein